MMKFAALALLAVACTAASIEEEGGVLVLTDDNFDDAISSHDTLLVEFYAPWCGHCKKLAPEYEKAAKALKKDDLYIAKMDATANSDAPGRFEVQGYPTLKFFRNGKATDYSGGRTAKDIINYVKKKSGPAAKTLETADDADSFAEGAEVAVIGIFKSETSAAAKAFLRAAGSNDDVSFGISTSDDVAAKYDVKPDSIVLLKQFDEGRNDYEGDVDSVEDIEAFVAGNQLPLVIPFSQDNAPKIFGGSIKTHLLVFLDTEEDDAETIIDSLRETAKANKGKMLAVTVNLEASNVMGYFGITEDDLPTAVFVNMPDGGAMKKFMFNGDAINAEGLAAFADSYFAGDLKPFLKSADAPADNDEPVKVVVGTTFEEIALDDTKDVLLEFYAPWCGHCKSLAPKWDALAETFANVDSVVIAKMDATENEVDHPDVNVKGFPTILFFPAKGDVQTYEGAREEEGFTDFLREHATVPFSLDGEDYGDHSEL